MRFVVAPVVPIAARVSAVPTRGDPPVDGQDRDGASSRCVLKTAAATRKAYGRCIAWHLAAVVRWATRCALYGMGWGLVCVLRTLMNHTVPVVTPE